MATKEEASDYINPNYGSRGPTQSKQRLIQCPPELAPALLN